MSVALSLKAGSFTESVIREMTRLNLALHGPEKAVNFAQGFPDFEPPAELVDAAHAALSAWLIRVSRSTNDAPSASVTATLSEYVALYFPASQRR